MKTQSESEIENATCGCTDDYGCGHKGGRCGRPLTEAQKAQQASIGGSSVKCDECSEKEFMFHTIGLESGGVNVLTPEQKRAISVKPPSRI